MFENEPMPAAQKIKQVPKETYYWTDKEPEPAPLTNFKPTSTLTQFPYDIKHEFNPVYDVVGKLIPFQKLKNTWMQKEVTSKPKVPTIWFEVYKGATAKDGRAILGYHPAAGVITDPMTGNTVYAPGKNMKPEAVYAYLFKLPGVIVGDLNRKTGLGQS